MYGKRMIWLMLCLLAWCEASAQRAAYKKEKREMLRARKRLSALSLSARGGLTQFWGELNRRNFRTFGGAGGAWTYFRTSSLSLALDYHYGQLGGEKRVFFNSFFVNRYHSLELVQRLDVLDPGRRKDEYPFHLNVYTGLGLVFFNARAYNLTTGEPERFTNNPETSARNPLFVRWGTPRGQPGVRWTHERIIPVGVAFSYDLSRSWQLGADFRYCFARTDKMDATSGYRLINPEEAHSYSDTPNDMFSYTALTVSYRFLTRRRK